MLSLRTKGVLGRVLPFVYTGKIGRELYSNRKRRELTKLIGKRGTFRKEATASKERVIAILTLIYKGIISTVNREIPVQIYFDTGAKINIIYYRFAIEY